jgi:hypothetical protein
MRRLDQAEPFKIGHHIANGRRRQRRRQKARNIARADRLSGRQIGVDNLPENLARALIELGQAKTGIGRRNTFDHGTNVMRRSFAIKPW